MATLNQTPAVSPGVDPATGEVLPTITRSEEPVIVLPTKWLLKQAQAFSQDLRSIGGFISSITVKVKGGGTRQEEFVNAEGWKYFGQRIGVAPEADLPVEVSAEGVRKWSSRVVLRHIETGLSVGAGTGVCASTEDGMTWKTDHDLQSKASTRAIRAAFRNAFGWVLKAVNLPESYDSETGYAAPRIDHQQKLALIKLAAHPAITEACRTKVMLSLNETSFEQADKWIKELNGRIQKSEEVAPKPAAEVEVVPDPNTDPERYRQHLEGKYLLALALPHLSKDAVKKRRDSIPTLSDKALIRETEECKRVNYMRQSEVPDKQLDLRKLLEKHRTILSDALRQRLYKVCYDKQATWPRVVAGMFEVAEIVKKAEPEFTTP